MTALETPAPDAHAADVPAAAWGQLAVSMIPDWRWPWQCPHTEVCPPMPGFVLLEGAWCYTEDIKGAVRYSRVRAIPDPDHWAWEGWLWRLANRPEVMVERGGKRVRIWDGSPQSFAQQVSGTGPTKGRALIAYAAQFGRWPGGAS